MSVAQSLIAELDREGQSTAKILGRVPIDRLDWKPHAKSMSIGQLGWHIATMPRNGVLGLREKKKDVTGGGVRPGPRGGEDLVATFRQSLDELKAVLSTTSDETLMKERFSFVRNGEPIVSFPMIGLIRTVIINHSIHHRGQLTVYLRLLEVSVPPMYGTTADESAFDR
jgi:uncharacterized damage-inducible protein DinB